MTRYDASVLGITLLMAVTLTGMTEPFERTQAPAAAFPLQLDFSDDGKQLKLLVKHVEMGLVSELWCYEGGPFQYGKGTKRQDGSVVFVHTSGRMTATTTFTPSGGNRVVMDILAQGPIEELKKVVYTGPCMQFWHSESFKRQDSLMEFANRCFLYTVRGPVGMLDTARGLMKGYKPDAPENNPAYTQWYVPIERTHPGDIWAFGASGDRPLNGIVGVTSANGRWLAAIGCAYTRTLGQGWHDCIHHVAEMQSYLEKDASQIVHRSVLYVMPNDKSKLLESFRQDFPPQDNAAKIRVSAGEGSTLSVQPGSPKLPELRLSMDVLGRTGQRQRENDQPAAWLASSWGGFVRGNKSWRMWAYPSGDTLELWVSLAKRPQSARIQAILGGQGWEPAANTREVPALVRRSSDGAGIAALIWERAETGKPARGVPATAQGQEGVTSVRGRLFLFNGDAGQLRERWIKSKEEWEHSLPYRMPLEHSPELARTGGVTFSPNAENAEEEMTYGLTINPPWKGGGTLHANFPEHFEHGDVGHGILRYSDKRKNPWRIAPDGRSASYEVESPELPGVKVSASAVAQGDRARLSLKIANGGDKTLENIKPLLCFWYAKLRGFPGKLSDNFKNTYVMSEGQLLALNSIPTLNPQATAKVAYARGCSQHDCDRFAKGRGGLIDRDVDQALIAVTDKGGARKVVIAFTPGKSILSNAVIPCVHADPYFGTLAPGQSAEATGVVVFAEEPLDRVIRSLREEGKRKLPGATAVP